MKEYDQFVITSEDTTMNIKRAFQVTAHPNLTSVGLLLTRVVLGLAFMLHGWGKMQNPMGWMGPDAPVPGVLQFLAAFSEFGGGLALILGLLFPLAMLGLIITMAVATGMHMFVMKDPFVAAGPGQGSYEPALMYLTLAIMFLLTGPGNYSADAKIFGNKR